jgi:hypothetical protein
MAGLLVMGQAVLALYFARFYRDTRDRLFLFFAAAFAILSLQRLALAIGVDRGLDPMWSYGARLLAFLVLLWGIIDKNRASAD